jgi:hypothetical protein
MISKKAIRMYHETTAVVKEEIYNAEQTALPPLLLFHGSIQIYQKTALPVLPDAFAEALKPQHRRRPAEYVQVYLPCS